MKNIKSLSLVLLAIISSAVSFSSWALNVTASVNKTKVSKDEVIQLKIVADQKLDGNKVDFSSLSKDFYLGRPNFSSSVNILNGTRTDSSIWTVAIAPQRIGKLTIPSFDVNGVVTSPITLNVTIDEQTPTTKDMVEVRTQLSKSELYPKESAILDTRIIVKVDPRLLQNPNLTSPEAPRLDIEAVGEPKQYQAVLDGMEVMIIDQSYRITAIKSGNFTIKAPTLTGGVLYGNNRSGTTKILTLDTNSPTVDLKVDPIPEGYTGSWLPTSKLSLSQTWKLDDGKNVASKSVSITSGDSLTRTITLTATGLTSAQLPNISVSNPDAFRVYSEKPSFKSNDDGSVTMITKQVLIAQHGGDFTLPAVKINWWDSVNKKPAKTELEGLNVSVTANEMINAVPPVSSPTSSLPDTTTIVKDSGRWPYIAGLFAALWVFSSAMWYRTSKANQNQLSDNSPMSSINNASIKENLIAAIKNRDPIATQTAYRSWKRTISLSEEDDALLRNEIAKMNSAIIGSDKNVMWDDKAALKLIEKAKARQLQLETALAPL
ncbi:BatD family protein [Vibrio barjaei]|uniref:BatD family protein n=1 Tax=Vibrio barjaei TaxID=1676683 RepID=UPI0022842729|nr:BatD family protein [Vibrio barjaei]MCY9873081.1 BatD family protein [Vibrio barjaei]